MASIDTRVTALLGIEHPIVGGTMMDLSRAPFVAAISNAGPLGILASAFEQHGLTWAAPPGPST